MGESERGAGGIGLDGLESRSFGPYDVLEQLGRGGMGVVYRAHHRDLRRECALKVFHGERGSESALRFVLEGQAAGKLGKHPHIVQVFDAGVVGTTPYIAMELVKGEPLDRLIERRGRIPEPELLEIGRKTAAALHHAHCHGIVHRDMKPGNIIIDERGEPQIVDFGLAKDLTSAARQVSVEGTILGTPAYLPPEQADPSRGEVNHRSDVYALGATLYHAATGAAPFNADSMVGIICQLLTQEPPSPRALGEVSRDFEAVILKAMEKVPRRRYQTAAELEDDLARLARGEAPRTRPLGPLARLLRRARPHRTPLLIGAFFLVFAAAAAAYFRARLAEVDVLFSDLARQVANSNAREVRQLLEPIPPVLEECRTLAERGLLPVDDAALAGHLVARLGFHPTLAWICYGDEHGRFTGAERRGATIILNRSWIDVEGGHLREEEVGPDGAPGRVLRSDDHWSYDPRERPWYRLGAAAPGPAWTKPYPWYDTGEMGITLALALREGGRLRGVFTADVRLDALPRFLAALEIGSGRAFILDPEGAVIAASRPGPPGAPDALLAAALAALPRKPAAQRAGEITSFRFTHARTPYAAAVSPLGSEGGLAWASAVVIPVEDFERDVKAAAGLTVRLGLAALLASVLAAAFFAARWRRRVRKALLEPRPAA